MTELRDIWGFPEDPVVIFFHKKVPRIQISNVSKFSEGKSHQKQTVLEQTA